jgi:hypothetical protein
LLNCDCFMERILVYRNAELFHLHFFNSLFIYSSDSVNLYLFESINLPIIYLFFVVIWMGYILGICLSAFVVSTVVRSRGMAF